MLSHKPWRLEGVLRLILALLVCVCAGSLVSSAIYYNGRPADKTEFAIISAFSFGFMALTLVLLHRRWTGEKVVRDAAFALTSFYAGLLIAAYGEKFAGTPFLGPAIGQMLIGMLSVQGAALVLVTVFLRQQSMKWEDAFGFRNNWRGALFIGLILAGLFLPLGLLLQKVSSVGLEHLPHMHVRPEEQIPVQTLRLAASWQDRLVLGIMTILLAPLAEEMLFRGIMYPSIKQAGFPRVALWATSILFAAIHKNLIVFLPLLLLALLLTYIYEKSDNLLAPITAHALFNAMNFTMLYIAQG
jgi:uncharacterized protein